MIISKTQIVNILFVSSFTLYGIGKYVIKTVNFSVGNVVSVAPLLVIIIFYLIDTFLKKGFYVKLNRNYILLFLFIISILMFSFYEALSLGHPGFNAVNTVFLTLFVIAISHAGIIVMFYNTDNSAFNLARLIYYGLSIDIMVNLLAYAAGFQNEIHYIPGRLNLPFSPGFYAAGNSVAIINLLIIGMWVYEDLKLPFKVFTVIHFLVNLVLIGGFNSRMSIMLSLLCIVLIFFRLINFYRILFVISFFTIPLLLGFANLIYEIFQLPLLSKLIKRVDYNDVTGFNGRRDLWERGIDWLLSGGEGFWLGNGYQGHYTIGLFDDLAELWHRSSPIGLHTHSSLFEYLLAQGVIGVLPFIILIFITLRFYKNNQTRHPSYSVLLGVLFYLLFVFQIDIYVYIMNTGGFIMFILISAVIVKEHSVPINESHEKYEDKHHHALV